MGQNKSENNVEFDNISEKVISIDNFFGTFSNKTAPKSDDQKIIKNFKDYTAVVLFGKTTS